MDGANADSDHSMTWEDFFGSTTDLAPTLLGIYDSLLDPKSLRPEVNRLETAKDARNDPPVPKNCPEMKEGTKDRINDMPPKDPSKITSSVKLPIATNKSSLYSFRTKSDNNGASDETDKSEVTTSDIYLNSKLQRNFKETKPDAFDNLSPNVKRMISSATETTTLKFQKKTATGVRSSMRYRSNIPLVGATSKISQSGVEILPSMEIYDQPCGLRGNKASQESPPRQLPVKTEVKQNVEYDVPTNNRPAIYDVPVVNQSKFESLSLPYIDQSIEISITSNDREFDTKLSSKENSPVEPKGATPDVSPAKIAKTERASSLHRNDFPKNESTLKQLSKSGPFPNAVGSTGNLKVQEKEVPRLNPPAFEVSRPLSMSSITSSSSTSSSGVQNKGGVNSAYLASIESLDDHSDVDVTSANGSNIFVNSAGLLNTSISEEGRSDNISRQITSDGMSGLSQLERVCAEIVQTENVYVEDLRQVVEGYLHVWRREITFSNDELSDLFNNIEDIYHFNRTLCEELNTCHLDATCMARCFVDNTSGFSVYTSYCTGYPRTMERLAALASEPKSAREFRERQIALGHALPLASYLLKPVQRILKYHLLLHNVVKQCACYETEYAFRQMTGIAQHIDDMKRRHEHAVRVQEIQSLLYGWNGPDLTTYGELCAEGTFRVFGAKAMRHVFLFDKMLLITKNREDGILAYKSHIMCNNMMLVESISGAPLSFHVIPWDAPRSQLTLQARSARHKREWTLLLKRVILENYNAVIPSHARQLVMELGQNKTDDDILAEKSHSLITQASMRKQLSAPEYLEKRKLDRDRRKTFENSIRGRLKKVNRKLPNLGTEKCDCAQVSAEKGIDYTCDNCYVDLCSDCETEINKRKKGDKCTCTNEANDSKCPECDRSLHYIDAGSVEQLERKQSCKCSDFTSQESFDNPLNKTRGYHSSDDIVSLNSNKDELVDAKSNIRNKKTCLKCAKIKENIPVTDSNTLHARKSRRTVDKLKTDTFRSKSKDDPQRSRLSKIGTWRRKSEPGLQQNMPPNFLKKSQDSDGERNDGRGNEKIEFECRNCGSNKITRKVKLNDGVILSDTELDIKTGVKGVKSGVEVKMYNTKNVPKKISKLKKNRAKGLRLGSDTTAKFYADFSTDVSTENILHISESTESLHVDKSINNSQTSTLSETISKDEDIDEETYKKLIEKTDSFKKNELEKVKFLNKQKVINEGSEIEENKSEVDLKHEDVPESCEEEQPLEQIISQLLMQNREFQKLLKKQQQSNSAKRRHQRLLKSHSNPEQAILVKKSETNKLKPKYGRQTSENLALDETDQKEVKTSITLNNIEDISEDDHIYETLRVESRVDDTLHNLDVKSKVIQHNVSRPKRLPSPPSQAQHIFESDYVYLSFDKLNKLQDEDGIYDVPVKSPEGVDKKNKADYYVVVDKKDLKVEDDENVYDNLVEVTRRNKNTPENLTTDYLPMNASQLSPNTPEIWLSQQQEHFNVSRDRKSGSLPRSFQVVTDGTDENNLSSFKSKPNSNSKTYLNRDGKVMSIDRPFTIASDQSELSYDDVENYMSEGDILKFNNKPTSNESDSIQNISQSTLELEEEIDRCYKNNFEKINLDTNKNENLLTVSQPNLNASVTSSCEVLSVRNEEKTKDEAIHPEHKIYKPNSSMLSFKNVLNRFKNRGPNKNHEETEINANDQSCPDNAKSDLKSPTNEKRSALNPRSYSKNLLQRFRSIIGDEHSDNNQNKTETVANSIIEDTNNANKSEIKVIVTLTDVSPTTSTIVYSVNDPLSRSVYEQTTLTDSQNEKSNLEALSHSCDNIIDKSNAHRPSFDQSVSTISSISSNTSSLYSKSNTASYQSVSKLPVYMQGSTHLGARIAQSDYVDPSTLKSENSVPNHANVLINKNSVRPDSLFSNSSFVTSSSEGTYQEKSGQASEEKLITEIQSDDSYYEKTFEKIESVTDEDVFRDSAVYSDQEEGDENKSHSKDKQVSKTLTRVESLKRDASFKAQKVTVTSSVGERTCMTRTIGITKFHSIQNTKNQVKEQENNVKPKVAPPVPVKPKISNIPSSSFRSKTIVDKKIQLKSNETSFELKNAKTIKHNTSYNQFLIKCDLSSTEVKTKSPVLRKEDVEKEKNTIKSEVSDKSQGNIQLKRMSFERASLDSATRKLKVTKENRSSIEPPKATAKSVLERRMEIEMKSQTGKPESSIKKPVQIAKPKSITTKVASFERSVSENDKNETKGNEKVISINVNSINEKINDTENDSKSSWVKQVVNKFQ